MLSPKLSKILAKKNVPHEGGANWVSKRKGNTVLYDETQVSDYFVPGDSIICPAYPEIALFKYAKVIWGETLANCDGCGAGNIKDCNCSGDVGLIHAYKYHTHTLADLFSSGASEEEIENYVLESLEKK